MYLNRGLMFQTGQEHGRQAHRIEMGDGMQKAYYKFVSIDPDTGAETGTYLTLENPPVESLPHPIKLGTVLNFKINGKGDFKPYKYIDMTLKGR